MRSLLENEHRGAFAQYKPGAVGVERPRCLNGVGVGVGVGVRVGGWALGGLHVGDMGGGNMWDES